MLNNGTTLNSSSPNAVWRAAAALAPKTDGSTTNNLYVYSNDAYISIPNQIRTGLTQSYASPSVSIERSNVQTGVGDMLVAQEDTSSTNVRIAMVSSTYEFEIPFISPYKFVGNGRALSISNDANSSTEDYATIDLGTIVISFGLPTQYLSTVSEEPMAVYVEIYAAADDSARFGFQTFAPVLTYPVYQVGAGSVGRFYQIGTSNYTLPPSGSSTPAVEPYAPKAVVNNSFEDYTSMYYSKTT